MPNPYIKIQQMRKRVSIDELSPVATGLFNENKKGYKVLAYRWAAIIPVTSLQQEFQAMMQAQTSHLIRMRYFADLQLTHRITLGSRHFHIVAPMNPDERNIEHMLQVKEVFDEGTT